MAHKISTRDSQDFQSGNNFDLEKNRFRFKVAETKSELDQVFNLLKSSYQRSNPFTIYHAIPTTSILICCDKEKVLCSLSLVNDSAFNLPLEKDIRITSLKRQGSGVAEICDVCYDPADERSILAIEQLIQYSLEFGIKVFNVKKYFFVSFNDKIDTIFSEKSFESLTNQMPFFSQYYQTKNSKLRYRSLREQDALNCEFLESFMTAEFPDIVFKNSYIPTMSPSLMNYYFNNKTDVFRSLDELDSLKIRNFYIQMGAYEPILPETNIQSLRTEARYQVSCDAVVLDENYQPTEFGLEVVSIARSGIAFLSGKKFDNGLKLNIRIEIGSFILTDILVEVNSHYESQIAARVIETDHYWKKYLSFLERNRASVFQGQNLISNG